MEQQAVYLGILPDLSLNGHCVASHGQIRDKNVCSVQPLLLCSMRLTTNQSLTVLSGCQCKCLRMFVHSIYPTGRCWYRSNSWNSSPAIRRRQVRDRLCFDFTTCDFSRQGKRERWSQSYHIKYCRGANIQTR